MKRPKAKPRSSIEERAARIRQAIEQLRDKNGRVTPRDIVEAARDENHPLHAEFEWRNEVAAEAHRLDRARELIRYITVPIIDRDVRVICPSYVRDVSRPKAEQGYIALTSGAIDRVHAEATMLAELARCESAIVRARAVVGVLDRKHPGLRDKLEQMLDHVIQTRRLLEAA